MSALGRAITLKGWPNLHGCQHQEPWLCVECQRRRDYWMTLDRDREKEIDVIAARDLTSTPGHQWATDEEWRERFSEKYPLRSPG